ncbi:MAG: hypothetical protein J6T15_03535 [Bacilli bacterium]|nr:hypothetical protein [Bacilli bacterium]
MSELFRLCGTSLRWKIYISFDRLWRWRCL